MSTSCAPQHAENVVVGNCRCVMGCGRLAIHSACSVSRQTRTFSCQMFVWMLLCQVSFLFCQHGPELSACMHTPHFWSERSACASGANVVAIINGVISLSFFLSGFITLKSRLTENGFEKRLTEQKLALKNG